jgi:hypothetical protein
MNVQEDTINLLKLISEVNAETEEPVSSENETEPISALQQLICEVQRAEEMYQDLQCTLSKYHTVQLVSLEN